MMIDMNCTLPRTVGFYRLNIIYRVVEILIDSLGRDVLLFPEPGLFHFEPREYSLHLLKEKKLKINIKIYIFSMSASIAINKI